MSVYPFSMLMAPPYVAGLVPHSVTSAARAFARCQDEVKIASAIFLSAALAHQYQTALLRDESLFEYPAYFAWRVGVAWTVAAFFAIAAAASRGVVPVGENRDGGLNEASPASANEHESEEPSTNRNRREPEPAFVNGKLLRHALPALFVATVSAAPSARRSEWLAPSTLAAPGTFHAWSCPRASPSWMQRSGPLVRVAQARGPSELTAS